MSDDDDRWNDVDINVREVIKDFLDGYSAEPEEVMVIESIANSLDAEASNIWVSLWAEAGKGYFYSISDDGKGMTEEEFKHNYHSIGFSTKPKGNAIGFAGVGAKLYLAMLHAGDSIYTETKSTGYHGASELALIGNSMKWKEVTPRGKITGETGTYVELRLRSSSNLDMPMVEHIIQENYNAILLGLYGKKSILVAWKPGAPLSAWKPETESEHEASFSIDGIKCRCYFWLAKKEFDEEKGFDIVVLGKTIEHNQWFGRQFEIEPKFSKRICGLITSDALAKLLTTNKQGLKTGHERTWLAYKKAVDRELKLWLEKIGAIRKTTSPRSEELVVTNEVSDVFNKILKMPEFDIYNPFMKKTRGEGVVESGNPDSFGKKVDGSQNMPGTKEDNNGGNGERKQGEGNGNAIESSDEGDEIGERRRRPLRSGIKINMDDQETNPAEGWVTPEAVVVNKGHPVYKRCQFLGYTYEKNHIFRCVAMALIENVDPAKKLVFDELRRFYNAWAGLE
ncbi:MAG: ATP-binding protein [Candidatus Parvarchaeota archaeon]